MTRQPNIIIFLADDLGYGDTSPYDGWIETPAMDRMAAEGMRFTDFHSNGAVCSPTRAALLTGRYQQRVGIEDVLVDREGWFSHRLGLDPSELTFARLFKGAGYDTALFGKWHLGAMPKYNPTHHGFDEFHGYLEGAIDYVDHAKTWWQGLEQKDEEGYSTHLITDHSVRYIEAHKDGPFCLFVSHEAVHLPWQAPGDGPFTRPYSEWTTAEVKEKYVAMTQELDKGLGEVLDAVERCGIADNTFVFYFSDNGGVAEAASNAPLRGHKADLWEGGHRIPAIAWWLGRIEAGTVVDDLTAGMDLLPTIAQIAGIAIPEDRKLDGVSLKALLLDQEPLPKRQFFVGYEARGTAMRDGNWKFITSKWHGWELYDLSNDIGETHNLADEMPEKAAEMNIEVAQWRKDVHNERPLKAWRQ
jgi:arylsulfatase A-like enzyme